MKREKLNNVKGRVAELVKAYGSYRDAAKATGIAVGKLHDLGTNTFANPTLHTVEKLGLKVYFERA